MLYLGIDQHSKQLTISLRSEDGSVLERRQVSTRPEEARKFFAGLQSRANDAGGLMAILEVCGFNDWLIRTLREIDCREIVLIHPARRSRRKTDRRDAHALGELLWINRHRLANGEKPQGLRRVVIASTQDQEDRQLTAMRMRAGKERTRVINAIKHILHKHNLLWSCPTKTFDTLKARAWLKQLPLPEIDRLELDQLRDRWEQLDKHLAVLDTQVKNRARRRPDVQVLKTTHGVSDYSGLALASRIGEVDRFPRPRSLPNYWGITPSSHNSGETTDRLGSITKDGSRVARFILGQLVLHVLRKDARMRDWYQKIRRRRGSKIARVAVMRRLATIFWHMLKHGERYQSGGPARLRSTPVTESPVTTRV